METCSRPPAIVLLLDPEGRILRCNPYLEKLTATRPANCTAGTCCALFPAAEHAQARDGCRRLLSDQRAGARGHDPHQGGAPPPSRVEVPGAPDDQGNPSAILAIGQDVTRSTSADPSVQVQRLATIGEMVTGLAHESGNALQRIQACLEMLALQVQDQPRRRPGLPIQIAQDHLHQLYEESGSTPPIVLRREPTHISDVLLQAWEHLEPVRAGREVEFFNQVQINTVCRVDRYAMERVFRNILENALAAASDPVRIDVLWNEALLDGQPAVEIRLRDNGPGLNPEQKKRMFEPFYTTKAQSTGLGMAITKRLVEAHGGHIAIGEPARSEIVVALPKE